MSTDVKNNETGVRHLAKGYTVSNNTFETGLNNNDLIIGPSGSGKTGGYVIPNLQELVKSNSSLIVADTKNFLSKMFSKELEANGYDVYVIDFVNPGESTSAYNPLEYIYDEKKKKYSEQNILTVANALVNDNHHDPFWPTAAKNVVACLIAYVLEAFPDDDPNLGKVVDMYNVLQSQLAGLESNKPKAIDFLEEWMLENPKSFAVKKYHMFKSVLMADVTWGGVSQHVTNALSAFEFEEADTLFRERGKFRLEELGQRKIVVFLNVSDADRTFDDLINLFYTQALQALTREADKQDNNRLRVPVRIILDDFAAGTRIPDFDKTISVIRSRSISVSIILQSLTQLYSMYSEAEAMTIVNNCDHIVYMGGSDLRTAGFISQRVDKPIQLVLTTALNKVWVLERGKMGMKMDKLEPYSTLSDN